MILTPKLYANFSEEIAFGWLVLAVGVEHAEMVQFDN